MNWVVRCTVARKVVSTGEVANCFFFVFFLFFVSWIMNFDGDRRYRFRTSSTQPAVKERWWQLAAKMNALRCSVANHINVGLYLRVLALGN